MAGHVGAQGAHRTEDGATHCAHDLHFLAAADFVRVAMCRVEELFVAAFSAARDRSNAQVSVDVECQLMFCAKDLLALGARENASFFALFRLLFSALLRF